MPYSFNPFTGNFDNTPSTLNGDSAYSSVLSNSATWTDGYQTGTVYKANSATYATTNFANSKFFALSGGLISGNTRINGDVTIFGNLTSTGTQTFANTIFSTTSALSVVHVGSGPAVWVGNNGSGDIASFNDIDQGIEVFHIGGANGDFPNVGVKTSAPNKDFTVSGEISATGDIWTTGRILSGNQELASIFRPDIDKGLSVFNTVQSNSATNWNYQGTDLKNLSASWVGGNAAFTNLVSNSAAYLSSVDLSFLSVSANWNSVYNTVQSNSATAWNYQGTDLKDLSGTWQSTFTNVNANSASWSNPIDTEVRGLTGSYSSVYSTVLANSATNWNYQGTDLKNLSSGWVGGNAAFTNLVSNSAAYLSSVDLSFLSVSADWNSVYNTVLANSAVNWNYQGTDLKDLSANWQSTLTTVSSNSAKWESVYSNVATNSATYATSNFVQGNFLPLSGGIVQGEFQAGTGTAAVLTVSGSKVGINTEDPNQSLTVIGNVSATGVYYGDGSNLTGVILPGQSDVNTTVQTNSASWQSTYTNFSAQSAKNDSVYSNVQANSANYILDGGNTKGSNLLIGTNDNFNLALETNSVPRLTIFNNGNVGINESSPEGRLHVTAGSAGTVVAQPSSVGVFESGGNAYLSLLSPTSHYAGVVMGGPTNPYGSYMSWNHDNLALKVATNHAGASIQMLAGTEQEALRIASSGNIGIGTTSPNEKLTVSGNISASGYLYGNASSLTNVIDSGVRDLSGNWQSTLTTVSSNSAKWESVYSNVNANSATYATVNFVEANFLPLSGGSIQGNVVASGGISVGDQFETATLFVSSGLVGINTELPNEALTVVGNVSSTGIIYSDNGTSDQWNSVYSNVNANSAVNWNYQGDDLKALSGSWQGTYTNYSTNSASYATSNFVQSNFLPLSGGNVNGVFEAGSGSITLFVSSGIVGINTESPNKELTVIGSISATNTIYTNYLELSDVKFTNEHLSNVSSITASNDFLKVLVGTNIKYLRLYDVE